MNASGKLAGQYERNLKTFGRADKSKYMLMNTIGTTAHSLLLKLGMGKGLKSEKIKKPINFIELWLKPSIGKIGLRSLIISTVAIPHNRDHLIVFLTRETIELNLFKN